MDDREIAAAALMTGAFAHLLAPDVVLIADGADVRGRDDCALALARVLSELQPDSIDRESINGEPGLAMRHRGRVRGVAVLSGAGGLVDHIWLVTAPHKLRSWN